MRSPLACPDRASQRRVVVPGGRRHAGPSRRLVRIAAYARWPGSCSGPGAAFAASVPPDPRPSAVRAAAAPQGPTHPAPHRLPPPRPAVPESGCASFVAPGRRAGEGRRWASIGAYGGPQDRQGWPHDAAATDASAEHPVRIPENPRNGVHVQHGMLLVAGTEIPVRRNPRRRAGHVLHHPPRRRAARIRRDMLGMAVAGAVIGPHEHQPLGGAAAGRGFSQRLPAIADPGAVGTPLGMPALPGARVTHGALQACFRGRDKGHRPPPAQNEFLIQEKSRYPRPCHRASLTLAGPKPICARDRDCHPPTRAPWVAPRRALARGRGPRRD